jgi:hypothetical protein
MRLHLLATSLLATGLLLSTLGCSKKSDPEPEPALEGNWDLTSSTSTSYSATGTKLSVSTTTFPVGNYTEARYYTFISTTQQLFASVGGAMTPAQTYTRSGSSAPTPVGTRTITQLTVTNLTLLSKKDALPPTYGYTTYETHYTRH